MKTYGFWILFISTIVAVSSSPPNLYLLKDGKYAHCLIANESENTAVTTIKQLPVQGSHYPNDVFYCKISTDPMCAQKLSNDVWKYDVSENYDLLPIKDRRLEDLKFTKTGVRKFVNIFNISDTESDFNFKLSVKIKNNAHIFLCDEMPPLNSNCYWFIIGGWKGKEGVVRKCSSSMWRGKGEKENPDKNSSCGKAPDVNYTTTPTNVNKWTNFEFIKTSNNFKVTNGKDNILSYTDSNTQPFKTKFVFVSSLQEQPGQWKINNASKMYKTGGLYNIQELFTSNTTRYTFSVLPRKNNILYIYLCESKYDNNSPCYKIILKNGQQASAFIVNITRNDNFTKNVTNEKVNLDQINHFTLKVENKRYTLLENSNLLLEITDAKIKPAQILIGSDKVTAWIGQSYGLLTANTAGETTINLNNGKKGQNICVAIFVQSCQSCTLTIELQNKQSSPLDIKTQSMKNTWEEIKLITSLREDTDLKLIIKLNTTRNERAFIGDIRDCSRNARVISTPWVNNEPISCNSLKFPKVKPVENEMTVVVPTYNNDSIDIFWLSEYKGTTKLQTELRYKGCGDSEKQNISDHEKNIVAGSLSKTNLRRIPYTSYNISFIDGNRNLSWKKFDFEAADDFSHEEKKPTTSVTQMNDSLIINVSVSDCKKIQGPLYYFIKATCTNKWCTDKEWKNSGVAQTLAKIELRNIFGQSNYKISLASSRTSNSTNLDYKEIVLKNTDPTAPTNVRNLTIYAKTNNSISIRWREPYPRNGELEKYIINYMSAKQNDSLTIKKNKLTNCYVWKDYICQNITGLHENTNYVIEVMAKNEGVDKLSDKSSINTTTKEEAPKDPENLQLTFDDQLNMTVTCSYPYDAIGPVRNIHVEIDGKKFSYPISQESRNYSQQINAMEFSAKNLTVRVKFSNLAGHSNCIENTIESPPKTPKILDGFLRRKTGKLRLGIDLLQDLEGSSEIFVYQKRPGQIYSKLTKKCEDLETLKKEFSLIINKTINKSLTSMKEDIENVDTSTEKSFIALLKNTYGKFERCTLFSEFSISEEDNYSHNILIGALVTLFLLCLCLGIIIYMYKKGVITYKPTSFFRESADVEMANFSRSVRIEKFDKYITKSEQQMQLQYNAIEDLPIKPHTVGLLPENVRKNRYKNIIAYDDTRVVLNVLYSNVGGDYINANYINGFNEEKAYIAAQAPTSTTLCDFWRMIWQENVECIVMLSKLVEIGKKKSEQYWPEDEHEYEEFHIKCTDTKLMDNSLTIRTLTLSCGSIQRQITQLHYEGWLDKDVPTSTQGLREVLRLMQDFQKPYLIHCSAGVGRTGTLILCDIAIKMAKATQTVDMYSILHDMRQQRMKLVQIFSQYVFAHQVVKDATTDIH